MSLHGKKQGSMTVSPDTFINSIKLHPKIPEILHKVKVCISFFFSELSRFGSHHTLRKFKSKQMQIKKHILTIFLEVSEKYQNYSNYKRTI